MNAVITNFFTNFAYPFFTHSEKPHYRDYMKQWIESVKRLNLNAFILHDEDNPEMVNEFQDSLIKFVKVKPDDGLNPIDSRWNEFRKFLVDNRQIENVFFTDIRDVTVLKNPFNYMDSDMLYVGDEFQDGVKKILRNEWIEFRVFNLINQPALIDQFKTISHLPIVNCGLFGGTRERVLEVINKVVDLLKGYNIPGDTVDMIAFNIAMHIHFPGKFVSGHPICTGFWQWDFNNQECWFQHK